VAFCSAAAKRRRPFEKGQDLGGLGAAPARDRWLGRFGFGVRLCGGRLSWYAVSRDVSEDDSTEDLKKIDVPTLFIHGDADQIVPIEDASVLAVKLVKRGRANDHPGCISRLVHDRRGRDQQRISGVPSEELMLSCRKLEVGDR
jgi:pimeloyl-ACP methyl ester carboxylesterase